MCIVRGVLESDIESIKKIYEQAFNRMEGLIDEYYPKFKEYVDFCAIQKFSYVALKDDVICGVLLACEKPDIEWGKVLYIELLAVLPEFQKKGIGTKLLHKLREDAVNSDFMELSLRTGCYLDAYQIYIKYGFRDTRSDRRYMILNIGNKQGR